MQFTPQIIADLKRKLALLKTDMVDTRALAEIDRVESLKLHSEAIHLRGAAIAADALANAADTTAHASVTKANASQQKYTVKLILMRNLSINLDELPEKERKELFRELGIEEDF